MRRFSPCTTMCSRARPAHRLLLGGTPQCMEDKYRGVFSYEALRSRLSEGRFASTDTQDLLSPIIRLSMLTSDEMFVLIEKLMYMHGQLFDYEPRLTQDDLVRFLTIEYNRVGADTHITPREIIRDFIELLNILLQNPGRGVEEVLGEDDFLTVGEPDGGERTPLRSLAYERYFQRLAPYIQDYIYANHWEELRTSRRRPAG